MQWTISLKKLFRFSQVLQLIQITEVKEASQVISQFQNIYQNEQI